MGSCLRLATSDDSHPFKRLIFSRRWTSRRSPKFRSENSGSSPHLAPDWSILNSPQVPSR